MQSLSLIVLDANKMSQAEGSLFCFQMETNTDEAISLSSRDFSCIRIQMEWISEVSMGTVITETNNCWKVLDNKENCSDLKFELNFKKCIVYLSRFWI